jgi:hypothetical protein
MNARVPWWEPTWRRIGATTAVLFVGILALLAGRVLAGSDPGLRTTRTAAHANGGGSDPSAGAANGDPYGYVDPGVYGGGTNGVPGGTYGAPGGTYGLPGGSSGVPGDGGSSGAPTTRAS